MFIKPQKHPVKNSGKNNHENCRVKKKLCIYINLYNIKSTGNFEPATPEASIRTAKIILLINNLKHL